MIIMQKIGPAWEIVNNIISNRAVSSLKYNEHKKYLETNHKRSLVLTKFHGSTAKSILHPNFAM